MKGLTTPTYSDLFDEKVTLDELLQGLPSNGVIRVLCLLNARLLKLSDSKEGDRQVFMECISCLSDRDQLRILARLEIAVQGSNEFRVFHPLCITYFLHYELTHHRELPEKSLKEADGLLRLLKAYLLIAEEYYARNGRIPEVSCDFTTAEFFQRRTWPLLLLQHEFNRDVDAFFEILKLYLLLDWLSNSEYSSYVEAYCALLGCEKPVGIIGIYLAVVKTLESKSKGHERIAWLTVHPDQRLLMDSISHAAETESSPWAPGSLTSMKKRPLYRDTIDTYQILNRNFLYRYPYEGGIHAFHERSGIRAKISDFRDLKSKVSPAVVEKRMFKTILELIYEHRKENVHFEEDKEGVPDAWVREGRYVILFEFKDTDIPDRIAVDYDHHEFLNELRKKHVGVTGGQAKSVRQLASNAQAVLNRAYDEEFYGGYSVKQLWVLPVLVCSGYNYSMPGINDYLDEQYQSVVEPRTGPLTVLTLEYLFRMATEVGELGFSSLIRQYHLRKKQRRQLFEKYPDGWNALQARAAIEEVCPVQSLSYKSDSTFMSRFFATSGLPKTD